MKKTLTHKTDNEKIIEYLISESEGLKLSKSLEDKYEKLDFCRDLIKNYGSRSRVCPILVKKYGISKSQAYRIFQDTQEVFGATQRTSREFWLDILIGFMIDSRNKAAKKGDFRSVATIEANMAKAIEKLAGTNENIPFEKVQPAPVMIGFMPELTKVDLPEDWEDQVKKLIKPKRKIDQFAEDAKIIENEEFGD